MDKPSATLLLPSTTLTETHLACFFIPAAGQPSLAKTLLHRGPAQGTFSQGLIANSLIARCICAQAIQYNKVPHEELLFYALCPVGVSAGLKTDDHSPKAKNIKHSIFHQRHIKLETVLMCEYVIGFRSLQCGWVSPCLPPHRSYLQRLAFMHALSDSAKNPNPNCPTYYGV